MPMTPDEHERLARVDERTIAIQQLLSAMDTKLDGIGESVTRHDEQIKTIQRGGGSALAFVLTIVAALVKDRLHL